MGEGTALRLGATACVAGMVLVLAAGGCGGSRRDRKVIRVANNVGGRKAFREHWEAWKVAFERDNPPWKLELVDLGNTDAAEFYKSRIVTDDLPEVVKTWSLTPMLADAGALVPLPDAFYEKFGIPPPAPYKGKRYASCGIYGVQGIAVNRKMWQDAGITAPPQTWDEFVAALRRLKAKGHRPLVYGGKEWSAATPLQMAMAANMYDYDIDPAKPSWNQLKDRGEVRFVTDPVARKIMQNMVALLDEFVGKGALSDGYGEEQRDFYGGKGATWIMGCWIAGGVESYKVDFDIEYWPLPSMIGRKPVFIGKNPTQGGWVMTTSAAGEKRPKALAALEAFFDPHVYQLMLNSQGLFGTAEKVGIRLPKSAWAPAQRLFDSMAVNVARYGTSPGWLRSLEDRPPNGIEFWMCRVMQEALVGTRDVDKLLRILDEEWANARKR